MAVNIEKKLYRILFLHGYRQNQQQFYERTGGLRKFLKNRIEFIYCEALHDVPRKNAESNSSSDAKEIVEEKTEDSQGLEKGWWLKSSENPERNFENDFDQTLSLINDIFQTNKIDGVWGFSMGGILASILARISFENRDNLNCHKYKAINFNFVIIAAASQSSEMHHAVFYDLNTRIDMPSLHIIGKTDKLVPEEKALELAHYFVDPIIYVHEQGHFIPNNTDSKKVYSDFFDKLYKL